MACVAVTILTRSPTVAKIADRTGCQWPWMSSKINDFLSHLERRMRFPISDRFKNNLGLISHRLKAIHSWQTNGRTDRRRQPCQ